MKKKVKQYLKWWLVAEVMFGLGICVYLGEEGLMELGCVVLDPQGDVYEECDK